MSSHNKKHHFPIAVSLWLLAYTSLLCPQTVSGQDRPDGLTSFLKKHCYECHDADSAEASLNFEAVTTSLASEESMRLWTMVHDRLARGEMPPKKADQPSAADRDQIVRRLADLLTEADRSQREVVLRRLNRVEYENTVRVIHRHITRTGNGKLRIRNSHETKYCPCP